MRNLGSQRTLSNHYGSVFKTTDEWDYERDYNCCNFGYE